MLPTKAIVKTHLREFSGFPADRTKELQELSREKLESAEPAHIKLIALICDVSASGAKSLLIDRIVEFLVKPESTGKEFKLKTSAVKRKSAGGATSASSSTKASSAKKKRQSTGKENSKAKSEAPAAAAQSDETEDEDDEAPLASAAAAPVVEPIDSDLLQFACSSILSKMDLASCSMKDVRVEIAKQFGEEKTVASKAIIKTIVQKLMLEKTAAQEQEATTSADQH